MPKTTDTRNQHIGLVTFAGNFRADFDPFSGMISVLIRQIWSARTGISSTERRNLQVRSVMLGNAQESRSLWISRSGSNPWGAANLEPVTYL